MDLNLAHTVPTFLAAFFASLVECVEALTVVLAVGSVRGWRGAISGSAAALAVLLVIVLLFGPIIGRFPLLAVQLGVGTLLLLFGLRWLRKAVLRAVGAIPLHDETAAFAEETALMRSLGRAAGFDWIGFGASFQITMLEGAEVVFIIMAIGAGGGSILPAAIGALAALFLVIILGFALHRPLAAVPENSLKLVVGVLLSAFGTYWAGEGSGMIWPGADWSILVLIAGYSLAAAIAIRLCRGRVGREAASVGVEAC
jgi:uncharacterized membrane protein